MGQLTRRFWPLWLGAAFLILALVLPKLDQEPVQAKYLRVKNYSTLNEVRADLGKPDLLTEKWASWSFGSEQIYVDFGTVDEHITLVRLSAGQPPFSLAVLLRKLGL
jgi:hypothetical protein